MRHPNGVAGCYHQPEAGGKHLEMGSLAKCCSSCSVDCSIDGTCNDAVKSTTAPTITDPTESTPNGDACDASQAQATAFKLLMKNDETRALVFGDQWDNTDEWNMYSASLRLGSSVTAATFKFGEDGKHVSYLGDEYLGLHCNCNTWEAGEFVKSDSLP